MEKQIKAIVFDIGHVLIEWNPRHLYRKIFEDEQEMEHFLESVCTAEWNEALDCGLDWKEALTERIEKFPEYEIQIKAYHERWDEMVPDALWNTVEIMEQLRDKGFPIYSITNFHHETFAHAAQRFPFLNEFDGIVVSGEVRQIKPESAIFHTFLEKYNLIAQTLLFIDDRADNIESAKKIGFNGIVFKDANQLQTELKAMNLLT